ncbi:MAG TPA: hypothetical protein VHF69_05935 [Candidatus Synoicihabitans sp.]|nr:hypothetical protein [Candidatus Synoicihabitans sp.]
MGFDDQTQGQPLVQTHKKTTKVNIAMVIGVLIFFVIAVAVGVHYMRNPAEARSEVHQDSIEQQREDRQP